jgi:hypothetical protein
VVILEVVDNSVRTIADRLAEGTLLRIVDTSNAVVVRPIVEVVAVVFTSVGLEYTGKTGGSV